MDWLNSFFSMFSGDGLMELIKTAGYFGIVGIVFAESGLFFGFFLPGDSLLFTAGFLSSQGFFNVFILALSTFIAAVAGDSVGYSFGKRVGKKIFDRKDGFLFNQKNLKKAQEFYEKHGSKTIVLARFTPIIRTFAPIVAGAAEMKYNTFISYNVIGGLLWTQSMVWGGYFLGNVIPDVDKYMLPIIGVIIFVSLIPTIKEIISAKFPKKNQNKEAKAIEETDNVSASSETAH